MKTQGQVAYEKFREYPVIGAYGSPTELEHIAEALDRVKDTEWSTLPLHFRAVWEGIAEAVVEFYEDPEGLGPIARDMEPEELAKFRRGHNTEDCVTGCEERE